MAPTSGQTLAISMSSSWKGFVRSWIFVPFGLVVMLYFVLALDTLIGLGTVSFPASVACLLILFFGLLLADLVLSKKNMETLLKVIDVPIGFALRTMNLYFTPSFILLPLSNMISGAEIGVLIGVFIVGYVVQFAVTAYTSRAIQLLLRQWQKRSNSASEKPEADEAQSGSPSDHPATPDDSSKDEPSHEATGGAQCSPTSSSTSPPTSPDPPAASRTPSRKLATTLLNHPDACIYLSLLLFVGLPVYYTTTYTMPLFLPLNVLTFLLANAIPPKIRRLAHPVLTTSLLTVLLIWAFAATKSLPDPLRTSLSLYRTQTSYLAYFRGTQNLPLPGAGDILASLLDASIVSLALPMYQHRRALWRFFFAIFTPCAALALPSLLAYPPLCAAWGVSGARSLAMAPRSVTLALAQLSARNLGGESSAVSPIAVVSGISGPIFGPTILRVLGVPEDDYVTWGVVLGANSSAIATAMLLEKDRRAAALSSLSMSIFGILFIVLTAIPDVVSFVRGSVGL
ncbi:uncharacterized protein BKCO1_5000033 [Diplodia corticola]|uniref:LrgB-like protein n=1 Tax=Diplodia corticola TaxID=236234 RepID=A0A1J9RUU1_9PEZI|nr:uncharacterized protein BKCO1_5000033 [Diplodia corticola]OJD31269.1 hypothetical protein BKCO1_5000033 [Diplodia corticola]